MTGNSITRRTTWAWLAAALLAAGCGGGGSGGDATAAGTAFTAGTISGFGSIIVNGIRFDDGRARVLDDDDQPRTSGDLKLGMGVEVRSDRIESAGGSSKAAASEIRFGAAIVGPVEAVDAGSHQLTVLGQVVEISGTTVIDDPSAAAAQPAVGDVVEVHAQFDAATGHYLATRIEAEGNVTVFKLLGPVKALDTGAKTFKIGAALISYANVAAADLPLNFANDAVVRVRLQTTQVSGAWQALSVRNGVRKVEDRDEAKVRGTISSFTSTASFSVNGLAVTTGPSTRFPDGAGGITLGAQVEVEGAISNGVLVATQVELEQRHSHDDDRLNELHGAVSDFDGSAKTFSVRGVKVHYGDATVFKDGTAPKLADGVAVEVKGLLGSDGATVEAMLIDFEG